MTDLFKSLLEVTLFSSAMILVVLSIKTVFGKRIGIRLISVLWMLVLVRLILPITFESPVHLISTTQENVSDVVLEDSAADEFNNQNQQNQSMYNNPETVHAESEGFMPRTEGISAGTESISSSTLLQQYWTFLKAISVWTYAFTVWIMGAVILLARHMVQMIRFGGRVRICGRTDDVDLKTMLMQNKAVLGLEKPICIAECSSVDMPVTLGIIKPKILIPKGYVRTIGRTQLSLIIMHELCHIKRNDIFKNYLWLFAKIIHWFNPLVLFAFKAYRDDIEIACDEMVLRHASEESKFEYSQGLLEAMKLSRNEVKTPAVLSFCKDRTKLRERVETMIKPKRKSKTAAVTAILMATVMVLACFTTACQPIPEEPDIAQTDVSSFESMGQQDSTEISPELVTQEQNFTVPDTWQYEITQDSTGNAIIVDAEVICPEFDGIDTVSFYPKNFTQQEVDELITYFVGDAALYNGGYREAKEILYDRIVETQIVIAMTQEQRDAEFGGVTEEELQKGLEDLQARYAADPDEGVKTAVTSELSTNKNGYEILDVYADFGGSNDMLIEVLNYAEESFNASFQICLRYQSGDGKICDFDGEPEEVAQAVLNDLGISDVQYRDTMMVAASNHPYNTEMNTRVRYESSIGGIPIRAVCPLIDASVEYTAPNWRGENISFDVSEKGLTCVKWSSHAEIGSTIEENVSLLSFEEITERFEESILLQPFWGKRKHCTYHITNVTLCMVPVAKEDDSEEYMLVPAWNFYGYQDPQDMAEFNPNYNESSCSAYCLMTISAEDGTLLYR